MTNEKAPERSRRDTAKAGLGVVVKEFRTTMAMLPAFGAALVGRPPRNHTEVKP